MNNGQTNLNSTVMLIMLVFFNLFLIFFYCVAVFFFFCWFPFKQQSQNIHTWHCRNCRDVFFFCSCVFRTTTVSVSDFHEWILLIFFFSSLELFFFFVVCCRNSLWFALFIRTISLFCRDDYVAICFWW